MTLNLTPADLILMPLTELESNQFYCIYYDSSEAWLYIDWMGNQTPLSVQQGCNRMLELMVEYGTGRILNDNTRVEGIWIGAAHWGAINWLPRMKEAGLECFAWIYGPNQSSRISTDALLSFVEEGTYNIRVFEEMEDAKEWLRQKRP